MELVSFLQHFAMLYALVIVNLVTFLVGFHVNLEANPPGRGSYYKNLVILIEIQAPPA